MSKITDLLGDKAAYYLDHTCKTIDKSLIHVPSSDTIDRIWIDSDRNIQTLRSLQTILGHGRLANTGYVSILPVDQDIEHTAGASFAPNPIYFDPENIVKLAIEGGCNAVASTFGILGSVARKYAHKIPFVVKLNHNELLSYPNSYDQVMFGTVKEAWEMGAVAVGATIYFGSEQSRRQLVEIAEAFDYAHELGMATILWCYLRNNDFKKDGVDYHAAADLTGQADRLGRIAQRNDDEDHAQHRDGSRNPERPLPGADMLQRIGDIGFGRSGVHLFGDARRILHDALPHLRIARHIRTRVAHQIPAQDRDDEAADRVRSVPDRHLGRQLLGRNPMRDQAVARREAAPLEHVVQNQQHAEQDDQRMDERRPVGLPRNPCADDRTAAENEVDDRTHRQARHHVPTAVGAVRQYAVDEFRHAVDQPDEGHDDAEGRFRDAVLGRKTGNG